MTETSMFWDGTVKGDAVDAPYSIEEFAKAVNKYASSDKGFVIPAYLNNLEVTGGATSVSINTGAAVVRGYIYKNITSSVTINTPANNSDYPRIDRVVLRLDYENNEVTTKLLTGVPAQLPIPAVCRDIPNKVYEVPLAMVYMPSGAAGPSTDKVYDERKFLNTPLHAMTYPTQNIMPNSEWFGIGAMWTPSAGITLGMADKFDFQARGNAVSLSGILADNMQIELDTGSIATVYTMAIPIHVTEGVCRIAFSTTLIEIYPSAEPIILYIRSTVSATDTITITLRSTPTVATIGQITFTQGYVAASFSPRHEVVLFREPIYNSLYHGSMNGSGVVSSTSGLWFGNAFREGIRGFLTSLTIYDTGSAGAGPYFVSIQDTDTNADLLRIDCAGLPNNTQQSAVGITYMKPLPVATYGSEYEQQLQIAASGAASMYVDIYIFGLIV